MPTVTNPPKQSRAVKTRAKLMKALESLLRHQEFEMISVQDIAQEAGVAVGSVYAHFKDKNAFLEALLESWREQIEQQLEISETQDTAAALIAFGSLHAALFEATKAVYLQISENGHILRALYTYARLHPDAEDAEWQTLVIRSFAPISDLLNAYEVDVTIQDKALATRMLGVFFNTIFIRAALMPHDTLLEAAELDKDTMIQQVTDMAYGYLTMPRER